MVMTGITAVNTVVSQLMTKLENDIPFVQLNTQQLGHLWQTLGIATRPDLEGTSLAPRQEEWLENKT